MTAQAGLQRVAILGGGMAALTTAFELSGPGWRDDFASITIYQRGWQLGGKGASSRGENDRIEEHGLHVLLGYYENAFRVIRSVYGELDRERTDPGCPIRTWRDALHPAPVVGVEELRDDSWHHWLASFPVSDDAPGEGDPAALTPARFVEHSARLIVKFIGSLDSGTSGPSTGFRLSPDPAGSGFENPRRLAGLTGAAMIAAATKIVALVDEFVADFVPRSEVVAELLSLANELREGLVERSRTNVSTGRVLDLLDLVVTSVRGILVDGLISGPIGFPAIDELDFRDWLASHGALPSTIDSALVRGLYDLVFAYKHGDRDRPSFSAGLGLFLAGKLFFDYRGALFWKMTAGMGDVVFAPMLQLLRRRGVRIEFFNQVERLELSASGDRVAAVHIRRQGGPAAGDSEFDPLVSYAGLPCFPTELSPDRLGSVANGQVDGEYQQDPVVEMDIVLRDGIDFDVAVLGVSLGAIPAITAELVERIPSWNQMIESVGTVATQALQIWLGPDECALGWPAPGAVVSGYAAPFDTFAAMSHLLSVEGWPDVDRPRTIAYFCGALHEVGGESTADTSNRVLGDARRFLEFDLGHFFPHTSSPDAGFDWSMLRGAGDSSGPARLQHQHLVAVTDGSDRYVQSLPGSGKYRLRADQSGLTNLVLTGDWTSSGLDAGCLEAATLSGIQASNVVRGRPLRQGVIGKWPGANYDKTA
jgi:uncharacterized protein with NAD-binding domain and iron-sulfur cluster